VCHGRLGRASVANTAETAVAHNHKESSSGVAHNRMESSGAYGQLATRGA